VLFATLIWGTLHPLGKLALREATPLQLLLGEPLTRQLVVGGAAILAGVALAQERLATASGKG